MLSLYVFDIRQPLHPSLECSSLSENASATSRFSTCLSPYLRLWLLCRESSILLAPQYMIWQAISFSRLFVWIYLFRIFWDKDYIRAFMGFVYKMQVPNIIFVLMQYYVLGLFQDNIGGLFGVERGCNGILNVYLCIVVAWGLNLYLAKEGRLIGAAADCFVGIANCRRCRVEVLLRGICPHCGRIYPVCTRLAQDDRLSGSNRSPHCCGIVCFCSNKPVSIRNIG